MLSTVDIFQDLPAEALAHLATHGRPRTFSAGELLLRQGEASAHMYVIVRGRVSKSWVHPDLSEPVDVLELGPSDVVGELGLLDGEPCGESVTALEETHTITLSDSALAETLLLYPVLAVGLLTSLSRHVRSLEDLGARARQLRLLTQGREHG